MTNIHKTLFLLFVIIATISCAPIHDAQHTLDVADSLRAEGFAYSDSMSIANAVASLSKVRYFHPSDYAKANYYYGRLLRERGNQVEAMQCFINASHTDPTTPIFKRIGSRFRKKSDEDYNLLGRVYSNIGTLSHLADEFDLSYQMYEQSAEQFKKANNMSLYYYALYEMAYELAEQNIETETLDIINRIENECTDPAVIALTNLARAELYLNIEQYDSAILYVNKELSYYHYEPTGIMIKAQSFSALNLKDSAIHYAKHIINNDFHLNNRSNAYYILQHDDFNITTDSVNQLAANRTDVNNILDIYHREIAKAIQIFNYDKNKKPNYKLGVILSFVIIVIALIITFALLKTRHWRRKQHNSIERERKQIEMEREEVRKATEHEQQKQTELQYQQLNLSQENDTLKQTLTNYKEEYNIFLTQRLSELEYTCNTIRSADDWKAEVHWNNYNELCNFINQHFLLFANKLKALHKLDEKEIRLCILVLIDFSFSNDELADTIIYSRSGFGKFKYRMTQKLGTTAKELHEFLIKMIVPDAVFVS